MSSMWQFVHIHTPTTRTPYPHPHPHLPTSTHPPTHTHTHTYTHTHTHTQRPVLHKIKSKLKQEFQKYGGTAELKILIVLCYYIIITVVSLCGFSILSESIPEFRDDLTQYFACESLGVNSGMDCQRDVSRIDSESLNTLTSVLIGFFPYVNFIYIISLKDIKQFRRKIHGTKATIVSKNISVTSSTKRSMV